MQKLISVCFLFFILLNSPTVFGQYSDPDDTDQSRKRKIRGTVITLTALDIAALAILSEAWYKDQPRTSFHFFNDLPEWKQADKAGHILCSYQLSRAGIEALRGWGVSDKKANLWGSVTGFLLISQVELLDGFSSDYGASVSDLAANSIGSLMAFSQYALWDEPRLHIKYSFHRSGYASQRPEVLGSTLWEEILKDYNGQTFWLSVDVDKFLPETSNFPKWLNIGLGYSVENIIMARDTQNPYRQYYLSIDLDLTDIKTKSRVMKYLMFGINMIHLPAPALEFSKHGMKFHWLYF